MRPIVASGILSFAIVALTAETAPPQSAFVTAVLATKPLAYYQLDSLMGTSAVGSTTYSASGGIALSTDCPSIGGSTNNCLEFDGKDRYVPTTLQGGIGTAGSIMAWVNLAALPSKDGHIFYVAGESQSGNDFDLQIEPDDTIHFYTASSSNVFYKPAAGALVGKWHMIVATLDTVSKARAMYVDGALVAHDTGGGLATKTHQFNISNETTFGSRPFHGSLDEVAVWDTALSAAQVGAIWKARTPAQ